MLAKYKNIIIIVIVVIVGFLVYSIFKPDPESESLLRTSGPQEARILGEDIIRALNQIDSLVLDASILSDPIIHSLVDHSRPIEEEPYGTNNPFGPFDDVVKIDDDGIEDTEDTEDTEDSIGDGDFTL